MIEMIFIVAAFYIGRATAPDRKRIEWLIENGNITVNGDKATYRTLSRAIDEKM